MNAIARTKTLERKDLPVGVLEPDLQNPNKMKPREFDLLCDNLERTGITDPILVRPVKGGRYRIVGGHHRWEAAKYLGFEEVPCTIIRDPDFDDEAAAFQLVRMNVIRGKMDPQSFFSLYEKMSGKYTLDVMQEMFGFAEAAEFKKLIAQTAQILPPDLQSKFKEAAKEIKTVDGLAKLLNEMFTKHGSSLPYGYMIFDYGGQRSVWLQVSKKTIDAFAPLGDLCREKCRTVDDLVGAVLQSIANGELPEVVDGAVNNSKPVVIPPGFTGAPTASELETWAQM